MGKHTIIFLLFSSCFNYFILCDDLIKVDCCPDQSSPDEAVCQNRGCIWDPPTVSGEPSCYFDTNVNNFAGYDVTGEISNTSAGITAKLTRTNTPTIFGNDETELVLSVKYITDSRLEITFSPSSPEKTAEKTKWKKFWVDNKSDGQNMQTSPTSRLYDVQVQTTPHFGIKVIRKISGAILFDTTDIPGFTVEDQFLSITTRTATKNVYGFGEQVHRQLKHSMDWENWGMFTRDSGSDGSPMNLYGVHPFYLCLEDDGRAHGIALVNTNAQSVELAPYPTVTYRTIGGVLSFSIILGPLPDQVVQQHTDLVGKPVFPPYWALGFHLCRWGYGNLTNVIDVLERNQKAGIPQDTQWIDIDYMHSYYDFTYDPVNFNGLPNFTQTLHSSNMKLVLITDPGIPSQPVFSYQTLTDGLNNNVFINDSRTGKPLEGSVWPGNTYYPDFSNPATSSWWKTQIKSFHSIVPIDGLWIDMNEPSDFVIGSISGCSNNSLNFPPFVPLYDPVIIDKTICMDAVQYGGLHYDLHSLYGFMMAKATKSALDSIYNGKRTFVLSRSTFMGSGAHTAHWLGDNDSDWPDMAWSIITCLEFNIFGIPFVGADICGFNGNTNEELCTRWQQLGAFYPFSRNHNSIGQIDQDPAVWSPESVDSSRRALLTRYKFLPYLNTLFAIAHANGSSVMRPLFFEFNTDPNTYDIGDQFLWGSSLMIVPILTQNTTMRSAYFPQGRWFDLNFGTEVQSPELGREQNLNIGMFDIGLYVRGGSILPWQTPAQTTVQSHKNPLGLLVALDVGQYANGFFYYDDSVYKNYDGYGADYFYFEAIPTGNQYGLFIIRRPSMDYFEFSVYLDTIQVYGLPSQPTSVDLNRNHALNSSQIIYDSQNKTMTLVDLHIQLFGLDKSPIQIKWNFF